MKKLLTVLFYFVLLRAYPQTAPQCYYQFNAGTPLTGSPGTTLTGGGTYTTPTTTGIVGGYINWSSINNAQFLNAQTVNTSFQLTVQFWYRVGYSFAAVRNSAVMTWGGVEFSIQYPYISFVTSLTGSTNTFNVTLDGINRKSWGYWTDGGWHHVALVYNASTGRKEIWIDGQLPAGFATTTPTGTLGTTGTVKFNQGTDYVEYYGDLDEIAVYSTALDGRQIYKNYTESAAGNHYTTSWAASVPAPQVVTGNIDPFEFPPGVLSPTVTFLEQIQNYPLARYGWNNTLNKNFNWIDPTYSGGRFQPGVSDAQAVTNSTNIQSELASKWNHNVVVYWSASNFNTAWINLANSNPTWDVGLLTFRAQVGTKLLSQALPASNYLQNGSAQYLNVNGGVNSPQPGNKLWRPTAPTSTYNTDGTTARGYISSGLVGLTNDVEIVNEDGEVFQIYSNTALANDPVVNAARIASGLSPEEYLAAMVAKNDTQSYRDQFMDLGILSGAKFTEYRIDGHRTYNFRYEQMRKINSKFGTKYYATGDFYVRYPYNWRYWISAWHGWQWAIESRFYEYAVGDSLWSPFVAAGWAQDETANVRNAQWLGLLKNLGLTGVDFFYTSYFNEQGNYNPPAPPPFNPAGYAYQQVATSYAQAIISRVQNYLTNGAIMEGDVPDNYVSLSSGTDNPGYTFYAGNINKLVVCRKLTGSNKYVISGTIQPLSNQYGNAPYTSTAKIYLGGDSLLFNIRRQGSVYIYDNSVSPPTWQQLDGWHENSHPSHWADDFVMEAENYDSTSSGGVTLNTTRTGSGSDWTNFTTGILFSSAGNVNYKFQNRVSGTQYFYVRAKSTDGTSTAVTVMVDGAGSKAISCITDTAWQWYRYNSADQVAISYSPTADADHWVRLVASNNSLSIDQVVMSPDNNYVTATISTCGVPTPVITASGATTFCAGGSVTLTSSTADAYLWSTGATTQSIIATTTGTYTVTITITGQGTASSAGTAVTVNSIPTATITAGGATSFCQGLNVALTASVNTSYLWSTGATTQILTATASGNYVVTVTNVSGCTKTSNITTVTVLPLPTATITPSGNITICSGNTQVLTSSTGGSYLWSTAATTRTINVTTAGNYTVRVTGSNGCSATSSQTNVSIVTGTTASITASEDTICSGDASTLMASSATSYLWSTGAITQSVNVTTGATYTLTVTDGNGCTATASQVIVEVDCGNCVAATTSTARGYWFRVEVDWNDVSPATAYVLENVNMITNVKKQITFNESEGAFRGLKRHTDYKYRLKTICGTIANSDWSGYFYYKTK